MANSGSFETAKYAGKRSIKFSWTLDSQNIENNTSTISWSLTGAGAKEHWYDTRNGYLNINRKREWTQNGSIHLAYGTVMASGKTTISHAADGSCSFSADCGAGIYEYGNYKKGSGSWSLPNIPRKTYCPNISGYIEESAIISLNPASSSFKHRIYYEYNGKNGYYPSSTGFFGATGSLPLDSSFYSYTPKTEGTGKITLYTYSSDGSEIGSNIGTITVRCSEVRCKPTITASAIDTNTKTVNITKDNHTFINGHSTAKISWDFIVKNNATIKNTTIDGINVSNPYTISNVSKNSFSIDAYDSRGYSAHTNVNINLIDYFGISIDFRPYRPLPTKDEVRYNLQGTFYSSKFGSKGATNTLTLKWYYRIKGNADWIAGGNLSCVKNGDKFFENNAVLSTTLFNHDTNYEIMVTYSDLLINGSEIVNVTKGKPVFNWENELFNVNGEFTIRDKNFIDYIYPIGSIWLTMTNDDPNKTFGGKWELLPHDRYLLCSDKGAGEHEGPGVIGGSAEHNHDTSAHVLTADEIPAHTHSASYSGANFYIRHGNTAGTAIVSPGSNTTVSTADPSSPTWGNGINTTSYSHNIDKVNINGTVTVGNNSTANSGHSHGKTATTRTWQPYIYVRAWKRTG